MLVAQYGDDFGKRYVGLRIDRAQDDFPERLDALRALVPSLGLGADRAC